MKIIRHILELRLSPREAKSIKRTLSVILLPIVMFYMTSANFLVMDLMTARGEDTLSGEEKIVSGTDGNEEDAEQEEAEEEEGAASEDKGESVEAGEETSETGEEAENAEESEGEKQEEAAQETGQESQGDSEEAEETADQGGAQEENGEAEEEAQEEEESAAETPAEETASWPEEASWEMSEDGEIAIIGPVELDKEYQAPQNKDVTVTFSKLPDNPGSLSVEEVVLSDEQMEMLGALSSKAYDITSDMEDGTFEYDLTLPKPDDVEKVEVKYAEDEDGLDEAKTVSGLKIKDNRIETSANHFTIFVVTSPIVAAPDCTGVSVANPVVDKCFNTIQSAIDDAGTADGSIINVKKGDYVENVNVGKGITLKGENGVKLTGQITVNHDDVSIADFYITNPSGSNGILIKADNVSVENCDFDSIGTLWSGTSAVQAININGTSSNIVIKDNTIGNVGTDSNTSSNKAIYVGDSDNGPSSNVEIEGNDISKVVANHDPWGSGGHGAYGILVNHRVTGLSVKNNKINNLDGLWAHAIGLENDTPGAVLQNNKINNLKDYKTPSDAIALQLESNPGALTISSSGNKYEGKNLNLETSTIYVDSSWSTLSPAANNYPELLNNPSYVYYGINAFSNIQDALQAVSPGGAIKVAKGTYVESGQIVIDKDVTIIGANKNKVIIQPAQDTGGAIHTDVSGWFLVKDNVTFNLEKVTLDGEGRRIISGVFSRGHGTIKNNIFLNISYSKYLGIGVELYNSDMVIGNNVFKNIGRIGVFNGNGTDSVIENNTYVGKGNGDWLDYAFEVGRGSNSKIYNNKISKNKGVASDGSTSAGILITSYYGPGTSSADIAGNNIFSCTDGIAVGYDDNDTSVVVAHDNNLGGNVNGVSSTKPLVDATNNWWGDASGPTDTVSGDGSILDTNPGGSGSIALGPVKYSPWYTDENMTVLTSPNAITKDATNITLDDAMLNARSGSYDATGHSFWVSLNPFPTNSPNIPSGVYSTPDMGNIPAATDFSAALSSLTTSGVPNNMPAITPDTTYYYVAWDRVGGVWYPGEMKSFKTEAVVPPGVPVNGQPNNGYENTNDFYFIWNASTAGSYPVASYEFQSSMNPAQSGGVLTTSVWHSGILPGNTIHSTGAPDGTWYWQVRAIDDHGNKSDWSTIWNMTIDTKAPGKLTINSPYNEQYFSTSPILNQWTAGSDNGPAGIDHYRIEYVYDDGHTFPGAPYRTTTGNSRSHTPGINEQGGVTIRVQAIDRAGNEGEWSDPVHYYYDATSPEAPSLVSPANNSVVPGASLTNAWSSVSDASKYVYESWRSADTSNLANRRWEQTITAPATSKTATNVADTTFWWRVKAVDAAGNESAWSELWKVTVDNIAPNVEITSPTDIFLSGTVDVRGTVTDNNPHHYWLVIQGPGGQVGPGQVNTTASFTDQSLFSWDTAAKEDGSYTIKLEARDAAGNKNATKNVPGSSVKWKTVTVDNTKPTSSIDGGSNEGTVYYNASNPWSGVVTGTASDSLSGIEEMRVSVQRGNGDYWNGSGWVSSGSEILNVASGTIAWTYTLPSPNEDTYTIKSHAVDKAGNVENTYTLTIIYDKTIPEVFLSIDPADPDGDNGWYDSIPEITLTGNDNFSLERIEYQFDSQSGNWTVYSSPVPVPEGKHYFYYRSLDKAGNYSAIGQKYIKVDTEEPEAVKDLDADYDEENGKVKLSWDVSGDAHRVYIYRGKSRDFDLNKDSLLEKQDARDDTYGDDDVDRGEKYYYKLTVYDEAGNRSDKVRVISIEIPEEAGAPAVVVNEGTDNLTGNENTGGGESPQGGGEVSGGESPSSGSGNEGQVLGEEMENPENSGWPSWRWNLLILLAAFLGFIGYRKFSGGVARIF